MTESQLDQKGTHASLESAQNAPDDVYVLSLLNPDDTIKTQDLLAFRNLQALYISAVTDLDTFPGLLGNLENLQWISIKNNAISHISEEIWSLKNLETLDLSSNRIERFPEINRINTSLTHLNLDNNQIESIPQKIDKLKNLESLRLANNQINILPDEMGNLKHLRDLYLPGNQLSDIPVEILNDKQLASLNLSFNKLTVLPDSIHRLSGSLIFLHIEGNSFDNDYVEWLRTQLPDTKVYDQTGNSCVSTFNQQNGVYPDE